MPHPALDGLHEVDWERFGHPHQEAEPAELLTRMTSPDPEVARPASASLYELLIESWTYEADPPHTRFAAPCLPFLSRLVEDPDPVLAEEAAEILHTLTGSQINHPSAELRAALLARIDTVTALVRHTTAPVLEWVVACAGNLGLIMRGVTVSGTDLTASYGTFTVPDVDLVPPGLEDPVGRTPDSPWPRVPADVRALGDAPDRLATALRGVLAEERNEPLLRRDALTAAVLVAPDDPSWVTAYLSDREPEVVRTGAMWVTAWKGLPWNASATRALVESWGDPAGHLTPEWFWESRDPCVEALAMRTDPELHLDVLRRLMDRGEEPWSVVPLLYDRHPRSRPGLAGLLGTVLETSDPERVDRLLSVVCAVPELACAYADRLVRVVDAGPGPLWEHAVRALIRIGDPRWRTGFLRASRIGATPVADWWSDLPFDAELAREVVRRLREAEGADHPVRYAADLIHGLLDGWGDRVAPWAAALVPPGATGCASCLRLVVSLGPAGKDAASVLSSHAADPTLALDRRLRYAAALAATAGDRAPLDTLAVRAGDEDWERVGPFLVEHRVVVEAVLDRLRDVAAPLLDMAAPSGDTAEERDRTRAAGAALAQLYRYTGERPEPSVVRRLQRANALTSASLEVVLDAERRGEVPAEVTERMDQEARRPSPGAFRGYRHHHTFVSAATLSGGHLLRMTGDAGPLMVQIRNLWERQGPGPWLREAAELLADTEHADTFAALVRGVRAATPMLPLRGWHKTLDPAPDTCDLLDDIIAASRGRG
ncbi:hypothetical protein DSY14_15675 [Nocardiopsis sp. MG754419]|nr:hypothetical protein [Nocardiopsis sp. MG754419]